MSSLANSPLRACHISPSQFFVSSAIGNPRVGFLPYAPTSANIPTVCQPYSHFICRSTLHSDRGFIERRERKTNHQVRLGGTGPSTHTYLFPHLFVVLRFPSAQPSYQSILRFQDHPPQSKTAIASTLRTFSLCLPSARMATCNLSDASYPLVTFALSTSMMSCR